MLLARRFTINPVAVILALVFWYWMWGVTGALLAVPMTVIFWAIFEQTGSTISLFADQLTRNELFGWTFPSSYWQSVNSVWVILLAPVFAWLWFGYGAWQQKNDAAQNWWESANSIFAPDKVNLYAKPLIDLGYIKVTS